MAITIAYAVALCTSHRNNPHPDHGSTPVGV
jgi:hypothetical protein